MEAPRRRGRALSRRRRPAVRPRARPTFVRERARLGPPRAVAVGRAAGLGPRGRARGGRPGPLAIVVAAPRGLGAGGRRGRGRSSRRPRGQRRGVRGGPPLPRPRPAPLRADPRGGVRGGRPGGRRPAGGGAAAGPRWLPCGNKGLVVKTLRARALKTCDNKQDVAPGAAQMVFLFFSFWFRSPTSVLSEKRRCGDAGPRAGALPPRRWGVFSVSRGVRAPFRRAEAAFSEGMVGSERVGAGGWGRSPECGVC